MENLYSQLEMGKQKYRPVAWGTKGAVSCSNYYATRAGLEILSAGGNAADAAVAVSLVLSVVEPQSSGLGGGLFSLIYTKNDGKVSMIDNRGKSSENAFRDTFLDENGTVDEELRNNSGRSSTIPGLLRGLEDIVNNYCTKTFKELAAPAVKLAREGWRCSGEFARDIRSPRFDHFAESRKELVDFYAPNGIRPKFGDIQYNTYLADTIETVAEKGADAFFKGEIAKKIVECLGRYRGIMTEKDLWEQRTIFRTPLHGTYRNYDVYALAPPASGGADTIEMLNILENFDLRSMGAGSAEAYHVLAETMKIAIADRDGGVADPAFVDVHADRMISKEYAAKRAEEISSRIAKEYDVDPEVKAELLENGCRHTTHFCIIDKYGNAVSQTQTIGDLFGNGVLIEGYGFVMNSLMQDFHPDVKGGKSFTGHEWGEINSIAPGKMPVSSNCPTIILDGAEPFLLVGGAGSARIIPATLQCIVNAIDFRLPVDAALRFPHISAFTRAGGLEAEYGVSPDTLRLLKEKGHKLFRTDPDCTIYFVTNALMQKDGIMYPASCYRIDGCGGAIMDNGTFAYEGNSFESL